MRVAKASYANVLAYNRALWVDIKLNRGTGQVTNTHSHTHSHTHTLTHTLSVKHAIV